MFSFFCNNIFHAISFKLIPIGVFQILFVDFKTKALNHSYVCREALSFPESLKTKPFQLSFISNVYKLPETAFQYLSKTLIKFVT